MKIAFGILISAQILCIAFGAIGMMIAMSGGFKMAPIREKIGEISSMVYGVALALFFIEGVTALLYFAILPWALQ